MKITSVRLSTRCVFLGIVFFAALACVPIVKFKDGSLPVLMAYPGIIALFFTGGLTDPQNLFLQVYCAVVIAAHMGLSFGFAMLVDKMFAKGMAATANDLIKWFRR